MSQATQTEQPTYCIEADESGRRSEVRQSDRQKAHQVTKVLEETFSTDPSNWFIEVERFGSIFEIKFDGDDLVVSLSVIENETGLNVDNIMTHSHGMVRVQLEVER